MDLSKEFDTLNHRRLLVKLEVYGLQSTVFKQLGILQVVFKEQKSVKAIVHDLKYSRSPPRISFRTITS